MEDVQAIVFALLEVVDKGFMLIEKVMGRCVEGEGVG